MVTAHNETAGSDILYHITTVKALSNIVKTNEFQLKPAEGSVWEEKFGASFYLSTARSKLSTYILSKTSSTYALIELDGRKLGQRYKVVPVDYWETNKTSNAEERLLRRKDSYEMEDRILSRTAKIPNAKSYIKSIHCTYEDAAQVPYMIAVFKWCKMNKISMFVYKDSADTLRMNVRKAIRFDAPQAVKDFYASDDFEVYSERKKYLEKRTKLALTRYRAGSLMAYWILYATPLPDKTKRDEVLTRIDKSKPKLKIRDVAYGLAYSDAHSGLEADLHNAKSVEYGNPLRDRETLDKIVTVLRKRRWSVKDFVKFLKEKWIGR